MHRLANSLVLLLAILMLAVPAAAQAGPAQDCDDNNRLDRSYSTEEIQRALDNLPSDFDEYSDCREVLESALSGGSDRGNNRPGPNRPTPADASDRARRAAERERAARANDRERLDETAGKGKPSLRIGGENVQPGSNGLFDVASASNALPLPLLLSLIAVALLALAGGVLALRRHVPALARFPLVNRIPFSRVRFPRLRR